MSRVQAPLLCLALVTAPANAINFPGASQSAASRLVFGGRSFTEASCSASGVTPVTVELGAGEGRVIRSPGYPACSSPRIPIFLPRYEQSLRVVFAHLSLLHQLLHVDQFQCVHIQDHVQQQLVRHVRDILWPEAAGNAFQQSIFDVVCSQREPEPKCALCPRRRRQGRPWRQGHPSDARGPPGPTASRA